MKRLATLAAVLLLSSCAGNPPAPESIPVLPSRLPLVVTEPASPASTEGSLSTALQDGWSDTLNALRQQLQQLHTEAMSDLQRLLEQARRSPPTSGAAGPGR